MLEGIDKYYEEKDNYHICSDNAITLCGLQLRFEGAQYHGI